jgi:hypothetical protein
MPRVIPTSILFQEPGRVVVTGVVGNRERNCCMAASVGGGESSCHRQKYSSSKCTRQPNNGAQTSTAASILPTRMSTYSILRPAITLIVLRISRSAKAVHLPLTVFITWTHGVQGATSGRLSPTHCGALPTASPLNRPNPHPARRQPARSGGNHRAPPAIRARIVSLSLRPSHLTILSRRGRPP